MKYKNGLVLGKFYPFHEGHKFLIESAAKQCERLTVLVCSLEEEYIPGNLRYDWIRHTFPDLNIVHITDNVAQYPQNDEDEFFWDIWIGIIMRELPDMDAVFTSETYGKELADRIGFKYPDMHIDSIEVDKARKRYPISGTEIRENPFKHWQFIPDIVRPFFMKKIILVGPESTGKTTLAKELSNHYHNNYVPEYGRTFTEEYIVGQRQITLGDLEYIAMGHVQSAKDIAVENVNTKFKNDRILILDTDLIVTQIWSEIYFKKVPKQVMRLQNDYIQKGDLYLLMDIDIPWVNDGTREFPHLRRWHYNRIQEELERRELNYVTISGDFKERLYKSIDYIDEYLKHITLGNKVKYVKFDENNFVLHTQ